MSPGMNNMYTMEVGTEYSANILSEMYVINDCLHDKNTGC